jgi:hypothetical protein
MDGHVLMICRYRGIALSAGFVATVLAAVLMSSGCGSTDCSFTASCAGGTAVPDAGEDAPVVIPNDCDLTKSPKQSPSCVDDGAGIFVDASKGKPNAKGTKVDPLPTISSAISLAVMTKHPRVYVCDGKYDETVKITSAVSVYGGFDCTWAINEALKPKVTPPKGPAIEVKSVADEVVIQDIEATGTSDGSVRGSSAIAALIVRSKVTLRSVTLTAGPGQDGAKGASLSNYLAPATVGNKGAGDKGGLDVVCTCGDGTKSTGGRGGDGVGGVTAKSGSSSPAVTTPSVNGGLTGGSTCTPGGIGANGEPDGVGDAVTSPGVLVETGWDVSKLGGAGKNGHPAQGGGGGGAQTDNMFGGGGGGCGGCGGCGGAAGANGGSSIALVSFESAVSLEQATLKSDVGGRGGTGGDGQGGQDGVGGGTGICKGGMGGVGAGGSGGAGGAGGDSIAIAWSGANQPTVTATEPKPGKGGAGGDGGSPGTGSGTPGTAGKPGNPGNSVAIYRQQ